ncbi:MAG: PEPxxWA-CTERM sorting domain-containing protein [Pseudomonadota bacterium]
MTRQVTLAAFAAAMLLAGSAQADIITPGFTFAVADGDHFHSNTGGAFGNPAGKAEVGRYSSEVVKGLSEYSLAGLTNQTSAFVTFGVFKEGGLFAGTNDTPFTGNIRVVAYQGNNTEDLSDFSAASVGDVGSFFVSAALVDVGDIFSFDITAIYNNAIDLGWTSLGIRLEQDPVQSASQAWTFDNFRLTTDNQTTGGIPEPGTWALMIGGFGIAGTALRRRRAFAL